MHPFLLWNVPAPAMQIANIVGKVSPKGLHRCVVTSLLGESILPEGGWVGGEEDEETDAVGRRCWAQEESERFGGRLRRSAATLTVARGEKSGATPRGKVKMKGWSKGVNVREETIGGVENTESGICSKWRFIQYICPVTDEAVRTGGVKEQRKGQQRVNNAGSM